MRRSAAVDTTLLKFKTVLSRLPAGLGAGVICGSLVLVLAGLGWLERSELTAMDRLFQARGSRMPNPAVTIVVADDAAVARARRWPLPRRIYGEAIERLTQAGVRTIACDVLFSVPSNFPNEDAFLAKACAKSGRVVQAAAFHVPMAYNPVIPVTLTSERRPLPDRFAVKDLGARCLDSTWATSALPELESSSPAMGHVNVHPEIDGTLRRIPHLIRYRGKIYPSLALAAATQYLGLSSRDILADGSSVRLVARDGVPRRVPLDGNGEAWINWVGGNDSFPTYSLNQLFDGQVPPEALKGRLVLLGVTAAGAFEHRSTPFSPVQPAVELQANAINDLISAGPLQEPPAWARFALTLGFACLVGLATAPRRTFGATMWFLGLSSALLGGAWWAMGGDDFYFPIVAPGLAGMLTYTAVMGGNYRREWESNWRTDASVAALARGGSLMSSGRERDLLVEVIGKTAGEVLRARQVFLVVDGQCFPERTGAGLMKVASLMADESGVILWNGEWGGPNYAALTGDGVGARGPGPELLEALREFWSEDRVPGGRNILVASVAGEKPFEQDELPVKGLLLASGKLDGEVFTSRDAVLFQTLAEQAGLALENLEYYERLQGRVDLANRNLREAYEVLSDERGLLAEERTKLAAAVESMESALLITDEKGRAVFDNGMTVPMLWDEAPLPGEFLAEKLRRNGLPEMAALFGDDGIGTQERVSIELAHAVAPTPEQPAERKILAARLTPLFRPDRQPLGAMLVVADVTAERELEKMKSDFVAFVAHELRTPLTSINGFASLLRINGAAVPDDKKAEVLFSIEGQCQRLNRMISDLLEVARLEPGREMDIRPQEFDLVALCRKVLEQQQVAVRGGSISLEFHCEEPRLTVRLDPDRVEQILLNLVSNGIKYSPDGGVVTISVQAGDTVSLTVADTGMGMTEEQVARLFEKYYRAPDARARGIKGTGLGLYLVKHLVEAQHGRIEASSRLGEGTTFRVQLPVSCDAAFLQ